MFQTVLSSLNQGFLKSLEIFALTLAGAIPLGLLISLGSMNRLKLLQYPVKFIVWIVRGTPLMLQLLIIYYGPGMLLGNNWWGSGSGGRFVAAIVTLIFNYACGGGGFCYQLRLLLLGDLPRRHRGCAQGPD